MPSADRSRLAPPVSYHGSGGENHPSDREIRFSGYSAAREQKE